MASLVVHVVPLEASVVELDMLALLFASADVQGMGRATGIASWLNL